MGYTMALLAPVIIPPMGMKTITRRFVAWIACFAMLFAALAPSVAQAMSASRGEVWAEICSVAGPKFVKTSVGEDAADTVKQQTLHLEHCPFCATHAASFALLPGPSFSMPLLDTPESHPLLFYQAPRPLSIWSTAQSRAPPAQA
jgi:hypothetical protein